jgi:hypothetical protein
VGFHGAGSDDHHVEIGRVLDVEIGLSPELTGRQWRHRQERADRGGDRRETQKKLEHENRDPTHFESRGAARYL